MARVHYSGQCNPHVRTDCFAYRPLAGIRAECIALNELFCANGKPCSYFATMEDAAPTAQYRRTAG